MHQPHAAAVGPHRSDRGRRRRSPATGFPGTPAKQVLMQIAIADDEVPNLAQRVRGAHDGHPGAHAVAVRAVRRRADGRPASSSGMVIYDFGLGDTIPLTNEPPPDNDVHSSIRNKKATTDMMKHVLRDRRDHPHVHRAQRLRLHGGWRLRRRYLEGLGAGPSLAWLVTSESQDTFSRTCCSQPKSHLHSEDVDPEWASRCRSQSYPPSPATARVQLLLHRELPLESAQPSPERGM